MTEIVKHLFNEAMSNIKDEKGQTMIEYALVAVLIAIILVFAFRNSGVDQGISAAASRVNSALLSN